MLELYDDPKYEDVKTCHLFTALEAAMNIEKRKVMVGPNDAVGIMLFNTVKCTTLEIFLHRSSLPSRQNEMNPMARALRLRRATISIKQ